MINQKSAPLDEQSMCFLEAQIPALAEGAFRQAYYLALSSGSKVLEAIDGNLIESSSDGSTRVIRSLPAPTLVVFGSKRIRRVVW